VVIFSASSDARSFQRSSRIIGPLLRLLFPHMSEETRNAIVTLVRKCAHLTEYAILAYLFWRALRKPKRDDPRPWSWREGGLAILFVALYASTDEFHQLFVPTREASVKDVCLDTLGAVGGIILIRLLFLRRAKREERKERKRREQEEKTGKRENGKTRGSTL
jgi:VanZ family protein